MAVLLFKLRGVEDDEADAIRSLLESENIDFYETTNGRWGLGYAAVWLHDDTHLSHATMLIQSFQFARASSAREAYQALRDAGQAPTFWGKVKQHPMQVLLVLLGILMAAALSMLPFIF